MLERYAACYRAFACLGGACPDSCCVGWEVVVDDDTAARYAAEPGELGDRLRSATTVDADGDRIIAHVNGHCPFWTREGLCEVQLRLGHDALCRVCREYPRLRQDYGSFVEYGLALSCPEAARLILSGTDAGWVEQQTDVPEEAPDYDPAVMALLQRTREPLLALLRDPQYTVGEALALALLYAYAVQDALESSLPVDFDPAAALAELGQMPLQRGESLAPLVAFHRSLEILTDRWRTMLETADAAHPGSWRQEVRCLASYYVNRYWLQAISDHDVIWRTKQMLAACLMARLLPGTDAIALYSKEVEHDGENVDCIWEAVDTDPAWTDLRLLGWLMS